jgi:hypothetical protein
MDHDVQPADESTAKLWVKNPDGAIFRSERIGGSAKPDKTSPSLSSCPVPALSAAIASGAGTQPPGSAGRLSLPATVKLLTFPPASAAQRWLKSVVAILGFCPRGTILPLAGEMGDWITMLPCCPNCEEAEMTLVESGRRRLVVIEMFPPGP